MAVYLDLEYIVFLFTEYCCPDHLFEDFGGCGGDNPWAILVIHVFQTLWKYNFFTLWPRNMYNTTFLTKFTMRNSFLALFFNLEIPVVHKSKMAATTNLLNH